MEKPNLNYINNLSGNDDAFRGKIINTLKKELPKEVKEYYDQIEKGYFTEAAQIIHKIKHKIGIMGMEKSYYLTEEFERNLKNQSADSNAELKVEFNKILSTMQDFVDSL
ncbi:Hpt domain-containing protein [Flavobacterium sp. 5]|uniref:Hpt domain-containing protein n=1 Tax=Flavobacterium sp. 5 TaxID=2035199 RepID=UPI000C2BF2F8|nr:histidine kinase [Flavobacterium sp. 5]PKB15913.1 hypothetical protein CLU82_1022 [Flavobacterium sp. 5]